MINDRLNGFAPLEFGGPPKVVAEFRSYALLIAKALRTRAVRGMAFATVLTVLIGVAVPEASPTFTGKTPELFHKGHRLRDGPKIQNMFGSDELPSVEEA